MITPYIKYFHNYASSGFVFDKALIKQINTLKQEKGSAIRVLDFGCGKKPFAHLFDNVMEYIGIDVYHGTCVDVVYDGKNIPFENDYFDLIFSSSVLEHVENIESTLSELARVLKPNGKLLSVVPFINHVHGTPYDFHRPTRFGWDRLLKYHFKYRTILAVDNRWQCVMNVLTSAINNSIYNLLKKLRNVMLQSNNQVALEEGGASPESKDKMKYLYFMMQLNPINFLLGIVALLFSFITPGKNSEGEITSGYLIIAGHENNSK